MWSSGVLRARGAVTLEVALIALVFFCLPLFEAPKNVFSILFLIAWCFNAVRSGSLGRRSPFDLLIFGLASILWIAPLYSKFGGAITPINSAPRWTLLALFVLAASRLDYTRGQLIAMLAALTIGGGGAVAESFWVWVLSGNKYPEFRSVGHVNHSSMYSLVTLAAGIGALFFRERWLKGLGIVAIMSTFAYLLPSRSLVGAVTIAVILVAGTGGWALRRWSFRGVAMAISAAVVVLAATLATPPALSLRKELVSRFTGEDIFSQRDKILNSALAVWDQHPLIGTGWSSFEVATSEEEVRTALAEDGIEYDPDAYAHVVHGHNLWTTMLIERGGGGAVLVTVLLLGYFGTFLPLALSRRLIDPSDHGIAMAAFLVAVGFTVAGLGNTTMMNEHGQAGMGLIAVAYGHLRGRGLLAS